MNIDEFEGHIESLTDGVTDGDISKAILILLKNAAFLGLDMVFDQTVFDTSGLSDELSSKMLQILNEEIARVRLGNGR